MGPGARFRALAFMPRHALKTLRVHQRSSHRPAVALDRILEAPGHSVIVAAPVGVKFPDTEEGVQPDLVFVSNRRGGGHP